MVYEDLVKQFNDLSDEDKNALLIYKTRLGVAINDINNKAIIETLYLRYKDIISNPSNMFIKMSVLGDIDFSSIESFKISLENIKSRIDEISTKLCTSDEVKVFRVFSAKKDEVDDISKTNIVSTSLDLDECNFFIIPNKGYTHYLYEINIDKDSVVAVCPYSILYNEKKNQLTVSQTSDQQEIILNRDYYDFTETKRKVTTLENGEELNIVSLMATVKNDIISNDKTK